MASDNEDDDLEALRNAALATLKQKEQPIEKVISCGSLPRHQNSPPWSDVPASIDFRQFADPIPEPYPSLYSGPPDRQRHQQQHHHAVRPPANRMWFHPGHNGMSQAPQRHRQAGFRPERKNCSRFPQRSFGNLHDRGHSRLNRGFPPHQGRTPALLGLHPDRHHLHRNLNPSGPGPGSTNKSGANLIVIQPHSMLNSGNTRVPPLVPQPGSLSNSSRDVTASGPAEAAMLLPQDKYHTSTASSSTCNLAEEDSKQEAKSKDKFSRYDKSDSEDDDLSDAEDIANQIDRVLQDDFGEEEETQVKPEDKEGKEEESKESKEAVIPVDHRKSESAKAEDLDEEDEETSTPVLETDGSDESLDLDALAGGEPVLADLEDLDSLVDTEPGNSNSRTVKAIGSGRASVDRELLKADSPALDSDSHEKLDDLLELDTSDVLNIEVCDDSFIATHEKENVDSDKNLQNRVHSLPHSQDRKRSPPPAHHNGSPPRRSSVSPMRRSSTSPRWYNLHRKYVSPRRSSRSPLLSRRRSISPRRSSLRCSRSPYGRPLGRRSISPRRKSNFSPHRYNSPLQRNPDDCRRGISPRRRSLSPNSRNKLSPRQRLRDGRLGDRDLYRNSERRPRDRTQEHNRLGQKPGVDVAKRADDPSVKGSDSKSESVRVKNSPVQDKASGAVIDMEALTPEERAKIEARRRKFDSRQEVAVKEGVKTISLKNIKTRDKKQKKKDKAEVTEAKQRQEPATKVSKKPAAGISLKKLRKKQESKKAKEVEEEQPEQDSPKAVGLADIDDDSDGDSDETRSWRKESGPLAASGIKIVLSQHTSHKARSSVPERGREDSRSRRLARHDTKGERRPNRDREAVTGRGGNSEMASRAGRCGGNTEVASRASRRGGNSWSTDEEDSNTGGVLSSAIIPSRSAPHAQLAPSRLQVQVQVAPNKAKKKVKAAHPDFANVYSLHVKRQHEEAAAVERVVGAGGDGEEVPPSKKVKKKKEKKRKHVKEEDNNEANGSGEEDPTSPAKPSVLDRLGKKVDLTKTHYKKEKRIKKSRSADAEGRTDLDHHIRKMKAKNQEIIRRRQEVQLDKERYG